MDCWQIAHHDSSPTVIASGSRCSDHSSFDLIEAHLVAPAVVELRRARRSVGRHRGSS
jgi:hypothetical protein